MDSKLQLNCEKLLEYREHVKKKMTWCLTPNEEAIMCAFAHLAEGKEMDAERYTQCKHILKQNVGMFNEFRGAGESMVITKMMLSDDPERYVTGALSVYKKLRERHKWIASPFMVMAALTIYDKAGANDCDPYLEELDRLYQSLKEDHPWLVTDEDRGYLAMMVCAGLTGKDVVDDIDRCYEACKGITIEKDAVHSMSQIMAFSGRPVEERIKLFMELFNGMKDRDRPVSKAYGLAALGALTLLDMPAQEILDHICETDDFLDGQRGFILNGARIRRLYASMLVLLTYAEGSTATMIDNITETLAMQIVEQIIMMIIISSAMAASTTAMSSSGSK